MCVLVRNSKAMMTELSIHNDLEALELQDVNHNNNSPCTAAPPARTPHQPYSWCLMFHGQIGRRGTVLEKTPSAELCAVEELHGIEQT